MLLVDSDNGFINQNSIEHLSVYVEITDISMIGFRGDKCS